MPGPMLVSEPRQDVLWLTINRPARRNALSLDLLDLLERALQACTDSDEYKCVVLTGAGERCFAAGGDLRELDALRTPEQALAMSRHGRRVLDCIRNHPLPVVAALNGHALGGGAELAVACDARVCAAHAEIGFLQARLNVTTAWGGGIDLVALLGTGRALAVLLEGRRLTAAQALDLGLVDRVCAPGQSLDDCVAGFLDGRLKPGIQVVRGFKAVSAAARRDLHEKLSPIEEQQLVATWTHADHWAAARDILK